MKKELNKVGVFNECIRILLQSRSGLRAIHKRNLSREIVVTFANGNYDSVSTVVIEVNGSPTCGRVIVVPRLGMGDDPKLNPPYVSIEDSRGKLVSIRPDSPKILSFFRLAQIAYEQNQTRCVMRKAGDKLHFFKSTGDSLNFDFGDGGDKSSTKTQKQVEW